MINECLISTLLFQIMRNLFFILTWFSFLTTSVAQTVLTHQTHGLLAGQMNFMKLCNYTDPGMPGANASWDFTGLRLDGDFEGK